MNKLQIKQENEKYEKKLKQEILLLKDTFSTHVLDFLMYMDQATVDWLSKLSKDWDNNPPEYLAFYLKQDEIEFVKYLKN